MSKRDVPDSGDLDPLVLRAPIGVALVDEHYRFLSCNDQFSALDGVSAPDHIGRTVAEVLPDAWPFVRRHLGRALAGEAVGFEVASRAPGSTAVPRWWQIFTYPVRADGRVRAVGAVIMDITAWRRASGVREEFLGLVSHQLRTPLTSIIGFAVRLARHADHIDRAELREDLQVLLGEAERLRGLLQNMLVYAAGCLEDPIEPYDIGVVIGRAVSRHTASHQGHVVVDVPPSVPAMVGRAAKIEQLLLNLLDNATKFSPAESPVAVRVEQADGVVRLTVRNRGSRLQGGDPARLFEPFIRIERSWHPPPGLGLGLSVAQQIVKAHAGRIWLQEWEHGVEAIVELPVSASRVPST